MDDGEVRTIFWKTTNKDCGQDNLNAQAEPDVHFQAFPNVTNDGAININYESLNNATLSIQLISSDGVIINLSNRYHEVGLYELTVNTNELTAGFYVVRWMQDGRIENRKLIVNE